MKKTPWYKDGLKFRCTGCGQCCTGEPGYVWVDDSEIRNLAAAVGVDVPEFLSRFVRLVGEETSLIEFPNGDCVFFDNEARSCKVYRHRPRQCRTWPFWESNIATPKAWDETCDDCPGAGDGPLVSRDQIEAKVRVIKV